MPDYDDCAKMRELSVKYHELTELKNQATEAWGLAEVELNSGIIINNISEKWSWKKQVLELCKYNAAYNPVMQTFYGSKINEKTAQNGIKAVENEINILKKIYESTPK